MKRRNLISLILAPLAGLRAGPEIPQDFIDALSDVDEGRVSIIRPCKGHVFDNYTMFYAPCPECSGLPSYSASTAELWVKEDNRFKSIQSKP